jgi:hypothetical protein
LNNTRSAGIKITAGNNLPNEAGTETATLDNINVSDSSGDTNVWLEALGGGSATYNVSNSVFDASSSSFDNIYLATFEDGGTVAPYLTAYITNNSLSNGTFAGLTAENDSALGSLNMYIADNATGSVPDYGFGLFNYSTGTMTLFSLIPENDPEILLSNEGNSGGSIALLDSFAPINPIENAPLP